MSSTSESVAEIYLREVGRLFQSYPPDASRTAVHDEVRRRYRELAEWLAETLPPCPELWRAVQELHVSMMLSNAGVAVSSRVTVTPPHSVWPKGMPRP